MVITDVALTQFIFQIIKGEMVFMKTMMDALIVLAILGTFSGLTGALMLTIFQMVFDEYVEDTEDFVMFGEEKIPYDEDTQE